MLFIKDVFLVGDDGERLAADLLADEEKGVFVQVGKGVVPPAGAEVLEGGGLLCLPGLIDAHVHLREPGFPEKETVASGTAAAARGGFTTVMPMPNLRPAPDRLSAFEPYLELLGRESRVRTAPYACITQGQSGRAPVSMQELARAGAAAFSDDGVGVQSEAIMAEAMEQAALFGAVIAAHTEDNSLKNDGWVHQGPFAEKMGYRGIPSACEYRQVERDLDLVRKTRCNYHICHISTKESVEMLRKAKAEGLPVSGEVTPHHLILCDEDVTGSMEKMNPPLRSKEDRQALIDGLIDGTIDMIATDHAPHTREEKSRSLELAPFGIVGLETAFPLLYTKLVLPGILSLKRLQKAMCKAPAKRFRFQDRGEILPGKTADFVLIDTEKLRKVDPERFASKGKNTPFAGYLLRGWPVMTFVGGKPVYQAEKEPETQHPEA